MNLIKNQMPVAVDGFMEKAGDTANSMVKEDQDTVAVGKTHWKQNMVDCTE